jgi:NAD(P)-dependent dehydrogenase (short-subunit alcohol dehydrogenase family)
MVEFSQQRIIEDFNKMHDFPPRTALVTGANKGIGFEISRQLGRTGIHVLLGARDAKLGSAAASLLNAEGIAARFIHIDLENSATIQTAAALIETEYGLLDILVNNAGCRHVGDGLPGKASIDAVRHVFEVNFFGALAVTQAMLPLLSKSMSARIVNVSSELGSVALNSQPDWEFAHVKLLGYNTSKTALNMLTVLLAAELKDKGIKVNSANPGFTATDLNGHRGHQPVEHGAVAATRLALLDDDGPTGGFFSADRQEPW